MSENQSRFSVALITAIKKEKLKDFLKNEPQNTAKKIKRKILCFSVEDKTQM